MLSETSTEKGSNCLCPYCLGRKSRWPEIGKLIIFLNGVDVGQKGLVVPDKWGTCPPDRFFVQMSYCEENNLRMVMPSHDLFVDKDIYVTPDWMPPVSILDNYFLHDSILSSLGSLTSACDRKIVGEALRSTVATCWRRRLPLTGTDIWPLFKAHGADFLHESAVIEYFDFGTRLLVGTLGRPPVKRRRMAAMSKSRYLTKAQRDLRLQLFGHD